MNKLFYFILLVPVLVLSQNTNENFVKTTTYKVAYTGLVGEIDEFGNQVGTVTPIEDSQKIINLTYFDGLGRPKLQIAKGQSNSGRDVITYIEHDRLGRQLKKYLPYVSIGSSLNFISDAKLQTEDFYAYPTLEKTGNPNFEPTAFPFSQSQMDNSPLNRVLKQAAPGEKWSIDNGHEIKFDYQTNIVGEVKNFIALATWNATLKRYDIAMVENLTYPAGQLYKNIIKDENWTSGKNNTTEEFKDKEGKVVLKCTYNNGDKYETYYVYDQFNNLTFVLPPFANGVATESVLNNLGYQYKYDYRNRLVEKKLPGKQWEFIIYDKLDRPVATGPAFNPYDGGTVGWLITAYDLFGRVIQTGWKQMPVTQTDRKNNQEDINAGINVFALATNNILTKNYYDNYNFPGAPSVPTTLPDVNLPVASNVKGLPTGSWIKVLDAESSSLAETSYTFYDNKYRPVYSKTSNFREGYTEITNNLDWSGKTLYTITKHKYEADDNELIVKDMFEYSDQDRLKLHKQQIISSPTMPEQLIAKNTYDELGQLISKNVGGTYITGSLGIQKVDYSYNVRGWLKQINNIDDLEQENDLFAFKINYDTPTTANPLFNGNISETLWKTSSDNKLRKYDYSYDHLNRLLKADYSKQGSSVFNSYLEEISYDKNGNIQSLLRNGGIDTDGYQFERIIDDLTYLYDTENKNQLLRVFDGSSSTDGFKDDTDGTNIDDDINDVPDYAYDDNGNMTSDANKGILNITYNHLNLPVQITFPNGIINYLYNAAGQKVSKTVDEGNASTTTDYLSGFQYKDGRLQFFPHAEGYVNVTESLQLDGPGQIYHYVFNYTDHLGNIRLSYSKDPVNNVVRIMDENHYYPFGLKHTGYNSDQLILQRVSSTLRIVPIPPLFQTSYQYKYNSKEFQDELGLNMYDYGARNYDPALGRWMNIDPLAEKYYNVNPYTYVVNNPIFFIDPDGKQIEPIDNKSGRRVQREIRKTFRERGFDNIAKLFKYNKKTGSFNNISQKDFDSAINKDVTNNQNLRSEDKADVTAMANGYFMAANSKEVHSIEAVKRGEDLSSNLSSINGFKTGADVDNNTGGGFNYKTPTGTHTVILMDSNINISDYRDNSTGNNVSNRTSTPGELIAHELVGHGLTNYNTGGNHFLNAIQLTNLYHRVTTGSSRFYRNGTSHGGNPAGFGVKISGTISWQIPNYIK